MAAKTQKIIKFCEVCKGTGLVSENGIGGPTTHVCPLCNGAKTIEWGYIEEKIT